MRGKAGAVISRLVIIRITPAYAGKSAPSFPTILSVKDHPRLCGEKTNGKNGSRYQAGSPPPMRGKDMTESESVGRKRITPAYAGKRVLAAVRTPIVWDHPRLCGEKGSGGGSYSNCMGSPPPMRGKGLKVCEHRLSDRITPAYAGKSGL